MTKATKTELKGLWERMFYINHRHIFLMKEIKTKTATMEDYRYCYNLSKRNMLHYLEKHWGGWKRGAFRKSFDPKKTKIILKNNRRIGFYIILKKPNCHYISTIQISKQMRGKGVGTYMLNTIENKIRKQSKIKLIELRVFKDNPAKNLYKKLGYIKKEEDESSILMKKRIK